MNCCNKCEPEWMHDGHSHSDEWRMHQSYECTNENCPCHSPAKDQTASPSSSHEGDRQSVSGEMCRYCLKKPCAGTSSSCENQPQPEWEHSFDLLWGMAPEDSLKGKKGGEVKDFIRAEKIISFNEGYEKGKQDR